MSLRKWFSQARRITDLERDLEFEQEKNGELEKLLVRAEKEVAELKSDLKLERKGHILDLRKTADLISRAQKLPERFIKNTEDEPKEEPVELITPQQMHEIEWAAREMRQNDMNSGMDNVPPLDTYINTIKEDPDRYINVI